MCYRFSLYADDERSGSDKKARGSSYSRTTSDPGKMITCNLLVQRKFTHANFLCPNFDCVILMYLMHSEALVVSHFSI